MHMPKQRRLDPDTRKEVAEIMQLKPNKKLLQNHLVCLTGSTISQQRLRRGVIFEN